MPRSSRCSTRDSSTKSPPARSCSASRGRWSCWTGTRPGSSSRAAGRRAPPPGSARRQPLLLEGDVEQRDVHKRVVVSLAGVAVPELVHADACRGGGVIRFVVREVVVLRVG